MGAAQSIISVLLCYSLLQLHFDRVAVKPDPWGVASRPKSKMRPADLGGVDLGGLCIRILVHWSSRCSTEGCLSICSCWSSASRRAVLIVPCSFPPLLLLAPVTPGPVAVPRWPRVGTMEANRLRVNECGRK